MSFSFDHAVYCIDTFEEHVRLLDSIARRVCKLDSSAVPERYDQYFQPYLIESMEFEYVDLRANANRYEIRKHEEQKKKNKLLRMFDNLKLDPVRSIFEDKIMSLMKKVKMIKTYYDMFYALIFRGYHEMLAPCTCSRDLAIRVGGLFLACI